MIGGNPVDDVRHERLQPGLILAVHEWFPVDMLDADSCGRSTTALVRRLRAKATRASIRDRADSAYAKIG